MDQSIYNDRRRVRPTQRLYVPPAKRTTNLKSDLKAQAEVIEKQEDLLLVETAETERYATDTMKGCDDFKHNLPNLIAKVNINSDVPNKTKPIVIVPEGKNSHSDVENDKEKEEMQRAIVNINRKSRPLIKHVTAKNDVLQINVPKNKGTIKLVEVDEWEDLLDEELEDDSPENQETIELSDNNGDESNDEDIIANPKIADLEHVIELYDFPSSFKTQDLIQVYNDINHESLYVKWCDETHALLVLGSLIQAQRALRFRSDIVKSRPMTAASSIAVNVALKSDLRPAMKRPQTCMKTARRMITSALGTKSKVSREVQQKEQEALRKAREEKKTQRQNERDAWDGFPRPSTA